MSRFSATLLDHARHPRNGGVMECPDLIGEASLNGQAPRVCMMIRINGDVISEIRFTAFGCGVTIAAASVLTELVVLRPIGDCKYLTLQNIVGILDGVPKDKMHSVGVALAALKSACRPRPQTRR